MTTRALGLDLTKPEVIRAANQATAQRQAYLVKGWFRELGVEATVSIQHDGNGWVARVSPVTV